MDSDIQLITLLFTGHYPYKWAAMAWKQLLPLGLREQLPLNKVKIWCDNAEDWIALFFCSVIFSAIR